MATIKEKVDKHEREIAAIRKLILEGMRLVAEERRLGFETRKDLRALMVAQKRTEKTLEAFIDAMRGGGNGHVKPDRTH